MCQGIPKWKTSASYNTGASELTPQADLQVTAEAYISTFPTQVIIPPVYTPGTEFLFNNCLLILAFIYYLILVTNDRIILHPSAWVRD